MSKGKIIFLNGVSSSGKTTLANKLIEELPDYFHLSGDDFDIIIEKMEDRKNKRLIPVETEYFFHRTVAMFSDKGVNLVVDHILHDNFTREDCFKVLSDYPVVLVGVHCPVEELERREKERGDRTIGQAKKQLEFVHKDEIYDIEVNTYNQEIKDCVQAITNKLDNINSLNGWGSTCKNLGKIIDN